MCENKPINIEEYKDWLMKLFDIKIDVRLQKYYESVSQEIKNAIENSKVYISLLAKLREYNDEYLLITNGFP
jgi:hypothetical protein